MQVGCGRCTWPAMRFSIRSYTACRWIAPIPVDRRDCELRALSLSFWHPYILLSRYTSLWIRSARQQIFMRTVVHIAVVCTRSRSSATRGPRASLVQ